MSLISCPECEKQISDKSNACIHCGYLLADYKKASSQQAYPKPEQNVETTEKDISGIKKYLHPSMSRIIFSCFGIIFFICISPQLFNSDKNIESFLFLFLWIGLCIWVSSPDFSNLARMKSSLNNYILKHGTDQVIHEFNTALPAVDDQIRLNEHYIFGKNTATIIRYEDIERVFLSIHRTNGFEDKRKLMATTINGKNVPLCSLPLIKKSNHPDLEKIIQIILLKNPSVHIGWK